MVQIKIQSNNLPGYALSVMDLDIPSPGAVVMGSNGDSIISVNLRESRGGKVYMPEFEIFATKKKGMMKQIMDRCWALCYACASQGVYPTVYVWMRSDVIMPNPGKTPSVIEVIKSLWKDPIKKPVLEEEDSLMYVATLSMLATVDQDPNGPGLTSFNMFGKIPNSFEFKCSNEEFEDFLLAGSIMSL